MPILTVPPLKTVSAYRPVQFETFTTGNPTLIIQNAVVELYFGGAVTPVSTFRVKPSGFIPNIAPGIDEYRFCIDVAERLRDLLGPSAGLPSQFVIDCPTTAVNNIDAINEFYLDITYEYLDLTINLVVEQPGVNDITDTFYAAAITRQHLEDMYLLEFSPSFPDLGRVLTNSPKNLDVCRTDNRFLSVYKEDGVNNPNAFEVVLYDSAGLVIGAQQTLLGINLTPAEIFTINTGIENGLKCITGTQQTPSYDLDNPNIAYYTVQFGTLAIGVFVGLYELVTYNLTNDCKCCDKRSFKLHWLNCLGGVDSYEFCSVKELRQKSIAITSERSLSWDKTSLTPHNINDGNIFKKSTTNELRYKITSRDLSNSTALWLSEMLGSVKVYFEIETNKFVPVIIEDTEQLINRQTGKIKYELTIQLAYCIIKQNV